MKPSGKTVQSPKYQPSILELEMPELEKLMGELGQPPFRAKQLKHHLMAGELSFDAMSNIPAILRDELSRRFSPTPLEAVGEVASEDGATRKSLLRAADGTTVESVVMLYDAYGRGRARRTVCVSTQAGCALGCTFCATGRLGLDRNLSASEIVAQVLHAISLIRGPDLAGEVPPGQRPITNLVFMGMGEPFANYTNVAAAIRTIMEPGGLGLGSRHITVSTVGIVPGIRRFTEEDWQVGLAVSLHAPNDLLRSRIMPVNDRYPIDELLAACDDYLARTRRRITFEYVLISGVNDSDDCARELAGLVGRRLCHVNLIPMNPIGDDRFKRPSLSRARRFQQIVAETGVSTTVRVERGVEIYGACGQLRRYAPGAGGWEESKAAGDKSPAGEVTGPSQERR